MNREPQNIPNVFGFSPEKFNQILVFIGSKPSKEIVAANPRMHEILRNDDHNVYIWGVRVEAN